MKSLEEEVESYISLLERAYYLNKWHLAVLLYERGRVLINTFGGAVQRSGLKKHSIFYKALGNSKRTVEDMLDEFSKGNPDDTIYDNALMIHYARGIYRREMDISCIREGRGVVTRIRKSGWFIITYKYSFSEFPEEQRER